MALSKEIKEIIDNWDEIKKGLPKALTDIYDKGVEDWNYLLENLPGEIDSMNDIKEFVEKVKKFSKAKTDNRKPYSKATVEVKPFSPKHRGKDRKVVAIQPTEKSEDNLTETKKSGSADISIVPYGKGLLVYGDGTRAIKEDLKAIGGEWSTLRRKDKPANLKKGWVFKVNQKAQIEKVINGEIKADNVETIKIDDTKYKVEGPVKLDVILEDEITEYTKTGKGKIAEAPNWLKTMRTFINMAGKTKTVAAVRKAVLEIHDRFDAKRGRKNAHIELIREIYTKLRPYANKVKEKTVDLPEWADLVAKCVAITSKVTVTSKVARPEIQEITLSGFNSSTHIKSIANVKAFFAELANKGISFHPDDDFNDVAPELGKKQCAVYNRLMNECFDVCDREGIEIYKFAFDAIKKKMDSRGRKRR